MYRANCVRLTIVTAGNKKIEKQICVGLLPVCMAQLLKRVASWSILQPWRAACFHGIWKIRADWRLKSKNIALNKSQEYVFRRPKIWCTGMCVCVYREKGVTWCGLPGPASWPLGTSQTESAPPATASASAVLVVACCRRRFSTDAPEATQEFDEEHFLSSSG